MLNLIGKFRNAAVHDQMQIRADNTLAVLRHVLVCASFQHSKIPHQVLTQS